MTIKSGGVIYAFFVRALVLIRLKKQKENTGEEVEEKSEERREREVWNGDCELELNI